MLIRGDMTLTVQWKFVCLGVTYIYSYLRTESNVYTGGALTYVFVVRQFYQSYDCPNALEGKK